MSKFEEVLLEDVNGLITLPLLHTCDAFALRSILESMKLTPTLCDVFSIELLYTYYGLPSYRPHLDKATKNPAYFSICLILESEKFSDFHKIYPFDSGAFEKIEEMRKKYFHHDSKIIDFELENSFDGPKKVIKTFYENNENYLSQIPKICKTFSQFDFEALSYSNLVRQETTGILDDRSSSIEIIFDKDILLSPDCVKQIIIPKCFKDDPKIMSLLKDNLNILNPLTYNTYLGNPLEYAGAIRERYFEFLKSN